MSNTINIIKRVIDKVFLGNSRVNYRIQLFNDLKKYYLNIDTSNINILEIGSKDGEDTTRLISLNPRKLTLLDLPGGDQESEAWYKELLINTNIESKLGNFAYEDLLGGETFDLIWCTGVLYHNTEQLRFLRRLYDHLSKNGVLVLESATCKNPNLKNKNIVEIIYPPSEEHKKKYHVSGNVTHLPSRQAIRSWLEMVGFADILDSKCFNAQSLFLGKDRAAFICKRPEVSNLKGSVVKKFSAYPYGRSL
jgi:SAM-dependent methyltransferase